LSNTVLDGNGVKAMPGLIPSPNPGSFKRKKNIGSQMGHTKNIFKTKKVFFHLQFGFVTIWRKNIGKKAARKLLVLLIMCQFHQH